jgi:intein/homing endonuclease
MAISGIKVSKEIEKTIVDEYNKGSSVRGVAKKCDVHFASVGRILRRNGVDLRRMGVQRTYTLNEHYFDAIDTPEKSYFLGLLYADGCNFRYSWSKGRLANEIRLELTYTDKDILEKFIISIGYDGRLVRVDRSKYSYDGHDISDTCRLLIVSKHLSKRLEDLGMVQSKTHILEPPKYIPHIFLRDFIRGYFDGDGGISITQGSKLRGESIYVSIIGTLSICEFIKHIVFKCIGIKMYIYSHPTAEGKFYVRINGREKTTELLNWFYDDDNNVHLNRKYLRYLELKKK